MNRPIVIEVCGRGSFPVDMLRYDQCAPTIDSVTDLQDAIAGAHRPEGYRFRLNCYRDNGPTVARWSSFCWGCEVVE